MGLSCKDTLVYYKKAMTRKLSISLIVYLLIVWRIISQQVTTDKEKRRFILLFCNIHI